MTTEIQKDEAAASTAPPFDVYIRFNDDEERDYCFQIRADTTFGELLEIFTVLPLNLSPSIFHERLPVAFNVSTDPGILTREGGLLFSDNAAKRNNLKLMKNSDVVSKSMWPGQLIVPQFPDRSFLKYSVIALLAAWLYTDLPYCITPTPGHTLSEAVLRGTAYVMSNYLHLENEADAMLDEMLAPVSVSTQIIFFVLHIAKVLVIYFILWVGAFNPYAFGKSAPGIKREDLLKIGWTSAKKITSVDFQDEYRKYKTTKAGGIIKAYRAGLLDRLNDSVVVLGPDEGFQSPRVTELPKDTPEDGKFRLSYDSLKKQEAFFQERYSKVNDNEFAAAYKHFRRFGPFDAPAEVVQYCSRRIKMGNGDVTGKPLPKVEDPKIAEIAEKLEAEHDAKVAAEKEAKAAAEAEATEAVAA